MYVFYDVKSVLGAVCRVLSAVLGAGCSVRCRSASCTALGTRHVAPHSAPGTKHPARASCGSGAVEVRHPLFDGLLDVLAGQVLADGTVDEGGKLSVRGEAQADYLRGGELLNLPLLRRWQHVTEPEPHFEPYDPVLQPHRVRA